MDDGPNVTLGNPYDFSLFVPSGSHKLTVYAEYWAVNSKKNIFVFFLEEGGDTKTSYTENISTFQTSESSTEPAVQFSLSFLFLIFGMNTLMTLRSRNNRKT